MVGNLTDREFADMLAAIWDRHGWTTEVTDQGGEFMVAGERGDGRRGVILVAPGDQGPVGQDAVETLQGLRTEKGVDVPVAATRSSFDGSARELAEHDGIHLVDPETLERTASAKGFEDLLEQYSSGGIGSRLVQAVPGLGHIPRPSIGIPSVNLGSGPSSVLVLGTVVVLIVGLLGAFLFGDTLGGFLAGLPLPELGLFETVGGVLGGLPFPDIGLGGGGYSVTAVSLVDGDAEPVEVTWDVKTQKQVVGPNGTAFSAPENHTFVIVQLNATNPGAEPIVLEPEAFGFATDSVRYGPQPLEGATGQLPIVVPPLSWAEGYLVFSVPEDADSGTFLALPGPDRVPISFERDRHSEFQIENG